MKSKTPSAQPAAIGAPAVLNVASVWEERARADVERLETGIREALESQLKEDPADDGADFSARIKIMEAHLEGARKSWKVYADMVYKLDRSVEPAKRSAEETITREEGKAFVTMFCITMRTACERIKENLASRMREVDTNEQGFALIDATLSEEFRSAVKSSVENGNLPSWASESVEATV